jgi:preprotein translocase subunit SecE
MATEEDDHDERDSEPEMGESEDEQPRAASDGDGEAKVSARGEADDDDAPAHLGATKYVHAAFFAGGILVAFLSGKILAGVWNRLAEWPAAVRTVPQLLRYGEDERATFTMVAGAVVGLIAVIQTYRRAHVRQFADEVAVELSKVTWPDKETVTNGTVIVVVATAVATVYIALLDRFWAFVTALIYGA